MNGASPATKRARERERERSEKGIASADKGSRNSEALSVWVLKRETCMYTDTLTLKDRKAVNYQRRALELYRACNVR